MVAGGPGTHPSGWVRCHHAPATTDPFRTADHTGFYLARREGLQAAMTLPKIDTDAPYAQPRRWYLGERV
jgi:hypothetical protein